MRPLLLLLGLAASALPLDVDELFARWNKPGSPGAAVAVVRDGKVVLAKGYGFAQLEHDVPIGPETVFHVASVSKQFTAFAVARLAAAGELSLDDDIRKHLPELHDFGKKITIRHLLHHTSGLRDQWQLLAIAGWRLDDVITMDHIRTMLWNQRELNFAPGERSLYSNSGYTLLAEIVSRVATMSFKEYCRKSVFEPLGMKNTHFHDDHTHIVKNRAYSYRPAGGDFKKAVLSYANVGATSLFTTAVDLTKWLHNFSDGKVGGPAVIAALQERAVLNSGVQIAYALGVIVGEHRGLKTISHSGGDAGFRAHVVWFPEKKLGVAVLSNAADCPTSRLALRVAELQLGLKAPAPPPAPPPADERKPAKVDPSVYAAYVGQYAMETGPVLTVTRRGDRLFVEATGQGEAELFPASPTRFFLRVMPAEVTFHEPRDGKSPGLTVHMNGRDQPARRTAPRPLEEFKGTYVSEELGTRYELVVVDGGLVARHRRHGDIALRNAGPDRCRGTRWFFNEVRFVRDDKGKLEGFRLSGGRVLNLWFARKE